MSTNVVEYVVIRIQISAEVDRHINDANVFESSPAYHKIAGRPRELIARTQYAVIKATKLWMPVI